MKKRVLLFVSILCLFNIALFSMPYSTLGNINIPDAYVLPHKMLDISYTNYFISDGMIVGMEERYNEYDFAGSIRFGLFDRGEIGIVYTSTAGVFGNLKFRLINETETLPAISFGLTNILSSVSDYEKEELAEQGYEFTDPQDYISNSPFMAISKSLVIITGIPAMDYLETSFHFGMGLRRFQGKGETVKSFGGVFMGMDVKPSRFWGLDVEWDSQNINVGLNGFYKNFTLRAGMYELEDFLGIKGDEGSKKIAINLKYTLDKFSELKAAEKRKKTLGVQQRAIKKVSPEGEEMYNEDSNPLHEELEQIRQRRKQAEKELEEIRKLLQE
ncbi:MAG: hypothetical protein DRH89_03795 [Candidatus Cloacimonadota bacterium]|nr:MAG: hypothetical protein DRH89_03795 [Candidatus Cloacimonadota bacterium]